MKKILFIIGLLIIAFSSFSQRTVEGNTVIARTYLIVEGDTIDFSQYITQDSEIYKLLFDNDTVAPAYQEGVLFYDSLTNSLSYYNDASDITVNIAQEQIAAVYNYDVVGGISDGQVCYADTASGLPFVGLAKADIFTTLENVIGVATHNIAYQDSGYITTFGSVRGLNTSSWDVGDQLYISSTTAGMLTNVKPEYPYFTISVAQVLISDASDGVILVNKIGQPEDIIFNAFTGSFLEGFDFLVTSNGTTITGTLTNTSGSDYLTMNFSDGWQLLDVNPGATITLTPGTDTNPQLQYVYIPKSTKVLTVSTAGFPDAQHIPVSQLVLQSALGTSYHGALRNQNVNNHLASEDGQGHINEMGARMRKMPCQWESGVEGTATINSTPSPDEVTLSNTGGFAWQMHLQSFPARDMATGDSIHIVNDFTTPYKAVVDLGSELTDATGSSLSGRHFSFVMWGVANKGADSSHVMLNLPTGSYNSSSSAITDADGYSVYDIPTIYNGVGFLIARFTFSHSASGGGTWTLQDTEDLRGKFPSTSAGGGGGGGGVTTFLALTDVPNSYVGEGGKLAAVASSETALEFIPNYWTESGTDIYSNNTGSVGIGGTPTTTEKLYVNGSIMSPINNGYYWGGVSATANRIITDGSSNLEIGTLAGQSISLKYGSSIAATLNSTGNIFMLNTDFYGGVDVVAGSLNMGDNDIINTSNISIGGTATSSMLQVNGDGVYTSLGRFINNANDTILSIDDNDVLWGTHIYTYKGGSCFFGRAAGEDDDGTSNSNTGFGTDVLKNATSTQNTAGGFQAGDAITSGGNNTLFGTSAGGSLTTTSSNCFFGSNSGVLSSGTGVIGVGSQACFNADGTYTIGIGGNAAYQAGSTTIAIGQNAGYNAGTGGLYLGYQAGQNETGNDKLYIDNSNTTAPLIHGDFSTDVVTINDVLVLAKRATAPSSPVLGMIYVDSTDNHIYFYNGSSWVQMDN